MATIFEVVRGGHLAEFELPEWEKRYPQRTVLVAPDLWKWMDGCSKAYDGSLLVGARTPEEHILQFLSDLRCAARPGTGDLKRMMPTSNGIWKGHPPSARIFGWFYQPYHFAAVSAALEVDLKSEKGLYGTHMTGVAHFLSRFDLEHTVVMGDIRAVFP